MEWANGVYLPKEGVRHHHHYHEEEEEEEEGEGRYARQIRPIDAPTHHILHTHRTLHYCCRHSDERTEGTITP